MGTLEQGFNLGNGSVQNAADIFRPPLYFPLLCNLTNPPAKDHTCHLSYLPGCNRPRLFLLATLSFPLITARSLTICVGNYICRTGRIFDSSTDRRNRRDYPACPSPRFRCAQRGLSNQSGIDSQRAIPLQRKIERYGSRTKSSH